MIGASAYRFDPIDPESDTVMASSSRLLSEAFPNTTKFTPSFLRWQYLENPQGPVVGFNATDESTGLLAAHYATIPVRALIDGCETRGLLSLNTATQSGHQGRGLFVKLAAATYERAVAFGYEFVVGVANANCAPGFVRKLKFQLVTPLNAWIGLGRLPVSDPGSVGVLSYEPVWDTASLRWRLGNPEASYALAGGDPGRACLVAATGHAGLDAILWRGDLGAPFSVGLPRRGRAPRIRVWLGLDPGISKWFPWYIPIPGVLRPSPLNLIFRDLTGRGRALRPGQVKFDALDFDAY